MRKRLLISAFLCFSVFISSLFAEETDTEQNQPGAKEQKIIEEWQTNPEAFAELFSTKRSFVSLTFLKDIRESGLEKVIGSYVEWPMTFGISPLWQGMTEEKRRGFGEDNLGVYHIIGPDFSGWIGLGGCSRQEGTEEITWEQMTWGIPPQSSVLVKMKIDNVMKVTLADDIQFISILSASEVEIETSSGKCEWPEYDSEIDWALFLNQQPMIPTNAYEVRVINGREFPVKVGLRSEDKGGDFIVPKEGAASVGVPAGKYHVYFQYAADPTSLYQGDSLYVSGSGFQFQLKSKGTGNYEVSKIK